MVPARDQLASTTMTREERLQRLRERPPVLRLRGLPGGGAPDELLDAALRRRRRPDPASREGAPLRRGAGRAGGALPAARPMPTARSSSSTTVPISSRTAARTASTSARTTCRWREARARGRARTPWSGSPPIRRSRSTPPARPRGTPVPTRSASGRCGRRRRRRAGRRPASSSSATRPTDATVPWFAIGGIDPDNVGEVVCSRRSAGRRRPRDPRRRRIRRRPPASAASRGQFEWRTGSESAPSGASARSAASTARQELGRAPRADGGQDRGEEPARPARRSSPWSEEERPRVVTVGAVISALICLSIVIGYAAGVEVDGERPNIVQVRRPARDLRGHGVGHVAGEVLGRARLPDRAAVGADRRVALAGAREPSGSRRSATCC